MSIEGAGEEPFLRGEDEMFGFIRRILRDQGGYFRTTSYTPPPAASPPGESEADKQAAEEAAAKERENLKKKKRPTLLTGAGGATGTPSVYRPQLIGEAGKKTLG